MKKIIIKIVLVVTLISLGAVSYVALRWSSEIKPLSGVERDTILIGDEPAEMLVLDVYRKRNTNPRIAIVFTHGSVRNGRREQFYPAMLEQLADNGYLAISYDLRGYGESLKYADIGSSQELNFYEDAARVLNYAQSCPGIKEVISMGHSCGGDVSFAAGADDPDVRGLIKLSSAYHKWHHENYNGKKHYLEKKFNNVMAMPLTYQDADRIIHAIDIRKRLPLSKEEKVLIINVEHDHINQLNRAKGFASKLGETAWRVVIDDVGHFFKVRTFLGDRYDINKIRKLVDIIDHWIQNELLIRSFNPPSEQL